MKFETGWQNKFIYFIRCLQMPYVMLILCLLSLIAMSARAQIAGSGHDFSGNTWSGGKICLPCHTPHRADQTISDAPLWNHETHDTIYSLYSSPTIDAVIEQPGEVSKLCLSCHDGVVALDSFGGATGNTFITESANISTDLSDDHPVGFDWDHQSTGPPGSEGGITCNPCHDVYQNPMWVSPLIFFGPDGDKKVECATCHDPHNSESFQKMLRISLFGSELCLHCHTDKL